MGFEGSFEVGEGGFAELLHQLFRVQAGAGGELGELAAEVGEIDDDVAAGGVVESVGVGGVEVDEAGDFVGETGADGAEFLAGDGVAGEDGAGEFERVDDGENVVGQAGGGVAGFGFAAGAEAAAGDALDVIVGG